jgi:hypothetical protein
MEYALKQAGGRLKRKREARASQRAERDSKQEMKLASNLIV